MTFFFLSQIRDGESLTFDNGVALGWPLAYLWRTFGVYMAHLWGIHGVPMAYLWRTYSVPLGEELYFLLNRLNYNEDKICLK